MGLANHLAVAQRFFENVGYWRFTGFFPSQYLSEADQIQKIIRVVLSVFLMLSAYDLMFRSLTVKVRVAAHTVLFISVSSLGLSFLLRKIQQLSNFINFEEKASLEEEDQLDTPLHSKTPQQVSSEKKAVLSGVKCKLLPLFEEAAKQEENLITEEEEVDLTGID